MAYMQPPYNNHNKIKQSMYGSEMVPSSSLEARGYSGSLLPIVLQNRDESEKGLSCVLRNTIDKQIYSP